MTDAYNDWNRKIIEEFRSSGGRVGGQFEGAPILLLTTTGARTGKAHTSPMMYLAEGDRTFVFASKAGAPTNPDWYHNLKANPSVTAEIGNETVSARAEEVVGPERDRIYAQQSERFPGFAEYQEKTTRTIPVVELVRTT